VSLFLARVSGRASRDLLRLAIHFQPPEIQLDEISRSTSYDMVHAPDEPYYAEQYWALIAPALESLPPTAQCLDLGCSQGRLTLRLAERFPAGIVSGCDASPRAIESARENAASRGLTNIKLSVSSIDAMLERSEPGTQDVVVMTEVTFFFPDWEKSFPAALKTLRPGGILVMSFRSQYFNALCIARARLWDSVDTVLERRHGRIFPTLTEFSWQTSAEVRRLFEGSGVDLLSLNGVGVCSGILGDPHDVIARPSLLADSDVRKLSELELGLGASVPDGGRYMLAIGRKNGAA
jgi:SAM-dependent methyltransferase